MKRLNKKGFVLVETLVVTAFVVTLFILVYQNAIPIIGEYEKMVLYDDVDSIYATNSYKKLLINHGNLEYIDSYLETNPYLDITDCNNANYYSSKEYCDKLKKEISVTEDDYVFITKYDISIFRDEVKNNDFFDSGKLSNFKSYLATVSNVDSFYDSSNEEHVKRAKYRLFITRTVTNTDNSKTVKYSNLGMFLSADLNTFTLLYGDIDSNGVINARDRKMLFNHLSGTTELTGQKLSNADINGDGSVNRIDYILYSSVVSGIVRHSIYKPLTDYVLYGDIDENGVINDNDKKLISDHLTETSVLTGSALANADINNDGNVNKTDQILISAVIEGIYECLLYKPLTDYVLYGDISSDGVINARDRKMLYYHNESIALLTGKALQNADINNDGNANKVDYILMNGVIQGKLTHNIYTPLPNRVLYGDIDSDGVINATDKKLLFYHLSGESVLTEQELLNADINGDGNVNQVDKVLVPGVVAGVLNHSIYTPLTDYILYGDIYEDGYINARDKKMISDHLAGISTLTGKELKNADINNDGSINQVDHVLIFGVIQGTYSHNFYTPVTEYTLYGDADINGAVNGLDKTLICNHVSGTSVLTGKALVNADINGDGNVNQVDCILISGVAAGTYSHSIYNPLTDYVLYGDISSEGVINARDKKMISDHLAGTSLLTEKELKNADINNDGSVNQVDKVLMNGVVAGAYSHNIYSPLTNYILYGDVDSNGYINENDKQLVNNHIAGTSVLTGKALQNADINNDGSVNQADNILIDCVIAGTYSHSIYFPLTDYVLYGDIEENGVLNARDKKMISDHVAGTSVLTGRALQNADINKDGSVNQVDKVLINGVIAGAYSHNISSPLTNYVLYGDVNSDGAVNATDKQLVNNHITGTSVLTGKALQNADINNDGSVNQVDNILVSGIVAGTYSHTIYFPLTNYILYGDVNSDGVVNTTDKQLVSNHISGSSRLTGQALKNADINNDGVIDDKDTSLIQNVISGVASHNIHTPLSNDSLCAYTPGQVVQTFNYTGGVQSLSIPCSGTYKLEVWGAQGGGASSSIGGCSVAGGAGGYSYGNKSLTKGTTVYVVVGGAGVAASLTNGSSKYTTLSGGYNGGGTGSSMVLPSSTGGAGGSGGGATHMALTQGTILSSTTKSNLLIVAGGGGGSHADGGWPPNNDYNATCLVTAGGTGGGTSGGSGGIATGGSQSAGGSGSYCTSGSYGQGGVTNTSAGMGAAGGGGGLYGGAGGHYNHSTSYLVSSAGGGGGSGYIGGVTGGAMSNGQRSGNGYARITLVSINY